MDYFNTIYNNEEIRVVDENSGIFRMHISIIRSDILLAFVSGSGNIIITDNFINHNDAEILFSQLNINRREEKIKQLL